MPLILGILNLLKYGCCLLNPQSHLKVVIYGNHCKVHEGLQAIGVALLVLFFVWGLIRTCTSWQDVKRPEQAFKLFLRFIIARTLVLYGMELMTKYLKSYKELSNLLQKL